MRVRNDDLPQYLRFEWNAYKKMFYFCHHAKGEVSGFAKSKLIIEHEFPHFLVKDAKIFNQVTTQVHTTIKEDSLASFLYDLAKAKENPGEWNIWWHTHNDFDAFFSGEDLKTISDLCEKSKIISVCINKMGNITARYDHRRFTKKLIPVLVPDPSYHGAIDPMFIDCQREVNSKVKEEKQPRLKKGSMYVSKLKEDASEEYLLEATGLGESEETIGDESDYSGGWSPRELYSFMPI